MYSQIKRCRICGNEDIVPIINLGEQYLTGVFPRNREEIITSGPLELVRCNEGRTDKSCGLVQLRHSYTMAEMYGDNYGYRSGLNSSMVTHLEDIVAKNLQFVDLSAGDLIVDIGSNDGTLLNKYSGKGYILAGIDPTANKFRQYYNANIQIIPEFFTASAVAKHFGNKRAKIVTSIAMFYDLEDPLAFMRQIYEILDNDGVWIFEQCYFPTMMLKNAYDTICHEHLEYYTLKQVKWMLDRADFKIIDVEFNDINGGSFKLVVSKRQSTHRECTALVDQILKKERDMQLNTPEPFTRFKNNVVKHRDELRMLLHRFKGEGKKVLGYGASTKGNVILQYCNITPDYIPYIAEVNKDKFGAYTPGTLIPIISEEQARGLNPEFYLVFPWHFRENILRRERTYLEKGGKLIMPLPEIEVISGDKP